MILGRRHFVKTAGIAGMGFASGSLVNVLTGKPHAVKVVNPYNRVPVSLIIDDSTCLVNLAHFGIPQFAQTFPDNYKQDWTKLPREIPDIFVREFAEWCHEKGVKGKYSVVPYPACTGWVSRFIPGWTQRELLNSLNLIREIIVPDWDIHPEMVSHTRVIDIKTGRPYPLSTPEFMENWEWSQTKSADELASYQVYALNILKEAGLTCEGFTTPGGYGSKNQENLSISALQSLKSVYNTEIPHYFRDLFTDKGVSVAPRVLNASGLASSDPRCVVSIIGCTDDWFGDWDGLHPGSADLMITGDLNSGRMVDVIESGEPAIMVCHWPGIYYNGDKIGFNILKQVVERLTRKYDHLIWMKLSEISRYWAARELTTLVLNKNSISLSAPFATKGFTLDLNFMARHPGLRINGIETRPFTKVENILDLKANTWYAGRSGSVLCFDLEKGSSEVIL